MLVTERHICEGTILVIVAFIMQFCTIVFETWCATYILRLWIQHHSAIDGNVPIGLNRLRNVVPDDEEIATAPRPASSVSDHSNSKGLRTCLNHLRLNT